MKNTSWAFPFMEIWSEKLICIFHFSLFILHLILVSESLCKVLELVYATIAEERPPSAHVLASLHV